MDLEKGPDQVPTPVAIKLIHPHVEESIHQDMVCVYTITTTTTTTTTAAIISTMTYLPTYLQPVHLMKSTDLPTN